MVTGRNDRTRRLAAALVLLTAASAGPAAAEDAVISPPSACVARYQASLGRIAAAEYQKVKSAGKAVARGDDRLPGALLFPPPPATTRTKAETAALIVGAALARSKGRSIGATEADAQWMGDRLRLSLSDYLTQSPSPYLCNGVEDYVATLRGFATRLGTSPRDMDALVATQKAAAERSLAEALSAMQPAPPPAPGSAATQPLASSLRPAAGLARTDAAATTGTIAGPAAAAPLPANGGTAAEPRTAMPTAALETVPDLAAAVDRLMSAAKAGGFLRATPNAMPIGQGLAVDPESHPVLARLAAARPYVFGPRALVGDRTVRMRFLAALSRIETLDYLMRARAAPADPLASAIDETFEAILKAHAADCTCPE